MNSAEDWLRIIVGLKVSLLMESKINTILGWCSPLRSGHDVFKCYPQDISLLPKPRNYWTFHHCRNDTCSWHGIIPMAVDHVGWHLPPKNLGQPVKSIRACSRVPNKSYFVEASKHGGGLKWGRRLVSIFAETRDGGLSHFGTKRHKATTTSRWTSSWTVKVTPECLERKFPSIRNVLRGSWAHLTILLKARGIPRINSVDM